MATLIALQTTLDDHALRYAVVGAAAAASILVLRRYPGAVLIALVVILPLEQAGFGLLLWAGAGTSTVRAISGVNELLVAALAVAALTAIVAERRRPDLVDTAALAYLAVVAVYLLLPHLFATGAPTGLHARLEALRSDVGFVVVFLAVRHAPLPAGARRGLRTAVMTVGAVVVAGALIERLSPSGWQTFMLRYADAPAYLQNVLHESGLQAKDALRYIYNIEHLRVSSIFYSPFDMADFLLVVAAVCIERMVRGDRTWPPFVLFAATLASLWFSEVRAEAVALGVVAFVALTRRYHPRRARLRVLAFLAAGVVVAVPVFAGSRFSGSQGASNSSLGHVNEFKHGVRVFLAHPLGLGLGEQTVSAAYLPGSTGGPTSLTSDNAETQVADELGILGLATWVAFMVTVMVALSRRRRRDPKFWTGAGLLALIGVLAAGQSHQVFVEYEVPWVLWGLVAVGLPYLPVTRPVPEPVPSVAP